MKLLLTVLLFLITSSTHTIANGCFQVESDALLTFKAGLNDPGNLMSSWKGPDCCNWSGVTCNKLTKHVVSLKLRNPYISALYNNSAWVSHALTGEMNPTLLSLQHLTHLDLSNNNFSNLSIPKFIASFENLVYLNLSRSSLQGVIPQELGNLSLLKFLDLGGSAFTDLIPPQLGNLSHLQYLCLDGSYGLQAIGKLSWLYGLSNLKYLDFSGVNLNNAVDWSEINKMSLLETLILSGCDLLKIPINLPHVDLTSLTKLDLSYNSFHDTIPNWLWNLTSLLFLDLSYSEFTGSIPHDLSNLASLNYLHIGQNNFDHGVDLEQIGKLHNLRSLDLSSMEIEGDITSLIEKLGSIWYNLEEVYLYSNNISGSISSWIAEMKNLTIIDLSYNSLSGHITSEIGTLTQLNDLYLSDNYLSGVITEAHFFNLSNLENLDLSNNILTIKLNDKWVPPFQLQHLNMESCKVGPRFPSWLQGQTQLRTLFLSNTSITDVMPTWFWDLSLVIVALSFNNISGSLPSSFELSEIRRLFLDSNNISGTMPSMWGSALEDLDLSRNLINGSIPQNLWEVKHLFFLDLSNNNISGEIPFCWRNISFLLYIDLSNNQITGELPASIGSLQYLKILQLDNNKLYGQIPSTLQQCKNLVFLSLARNKFSGPISSWIGQFRDLVVFQLRSNKFSGCIPPELGVLGKLQILDFAHNYFVGAIPSSVVKFSGMKNTTQSFRSDAGLYGSTYEVTLYIDINGQKAYTSTPLEFAKTIDFSGNNLNGTIPREIWYLKAVINLNLSRNYLAGEIPETIGGMLSLESLDLSFNELSGPIPQALSALSSLHNLNISYNNFSGKIPTGRQLDTVNVPSIYAGNHYLCGPLTDKNCSKDRPRGIIYAHGDDDIGREMIWLCIALVAGFIVGFWSLWGAIIFQNDWRVAYFRMVDMLFDKMYVHIVLAFRRLDW